MRHLGSQPKDYGKRMARQSRMKRSELWLVICRALARCKSGNAATLWATLDEAMIDVGCDRVEVGGREAAELSRD